MVIVLRGIYIGWLEGFATELFKTITVVGSFIVTSLYYSRLADLIAQAGFVPEKLSQILAFLIIFAILALALKFLRDLLLHFIHLDAAHSGFNKLSGLMLGVLRAVIFSGAVIFWLNLFPVDYLKSSIEEKSFSGPYLLKIAPKTQEYFRTNK